MERTREGAGGCAGEMSEAERIVRKTWRSSATIEESPLPQKDGKPWYVVRLMSCIAGWGPTKEEAWDVALATHFAWALQR